MFLPVIVQHITEHLPVKHNLRRNPPTQGPGFATCWSGQSVKWTLRCAEKNSFTSRSTCLAQCKSFCILLNCVDLSYMFALSNAKSRVPPEVPGFTCSPGFHLQSRVQPAVAGYTCSPGFHLQYRVSPAVPGSTCSPGFHLQSRVRTCSPWFYLQSLVGTYSPGFVPAVLGSNPAISQAYNGLPILGWAAIWDGTPLQAVLWGEAVENKYKTGASGPPKTIRGKKGEKQIISFNYHLKKQLLVLTFRRIIQRKAESPRYIMQQKVFKHKNPFKLQLYQANRGSVQCIRCCTRPSLDLYNDQVLYQVPGSVQWSGSVPGHPWICTMTRFCKRTSPVSVRCLLY